MINNEKGQVRNGAKKGMAIELCHFDDLTTERNKYETRGNEASDYAPEA